MSNLTLWGPRASLFRAPFAEIDTAFDELVRRAFGPTTVAPVRGFTPSAEIVRDGADAVVRLELPGVDVTKDVTVEVDGRQLVVRGERRDERSSDENGRTLREVRYGSFRRSFTLPKGVPAEAVSAGYDAGVLSVRVAGAYAPAAVNGAHRVEITNGPTAAVDGAPQTDGETGGEPTEQPAA